jgi:hypothetical protein
MSDVVDVQAVSKEAEGMAMQLAQFPSIKSAEDYTKAAELWKAGKEILKAVDAGYDSLIKSAHKLWKDALAKKASYYDPVESGCKYIKTQIMEPWDREQERIRKEAERKLAEAQRKQEEEARLNAAIDAEASGSKAVADAILDMPTEQAPVVLPKATPKVAGGPVFRTVWGFEVTDFDALVRAVAEKKVSPNVLQVNETILRKMAEALKDTLNIPGVRAFSRRV